jgi:hypothetical protein
MTPEERHVEFLSEWPARLAGRLPAPEPPTVAVAGVALLLLAVWLYQRHQLRTDERLTPFEPEPDDLDEEV